MGDKKGTTKLFSPVHLDLECVLFFKTRSPIDPVDFVHRICKEAASKPDIRRMRYVNRLTPVTIIGRATEKGLEEVGKTVLGAHFQLSGEEEKEAVQEEPQNRTPYSVSASSPWEI
jgi:tRNA acetyltransferase TAN1